MQTLLNHFQLSANMKIEQLEKAWAEFGNHLLTQHLASQVSELHRRIESSDFDTDEQRPHTHLAMIHFKDAAQAARAWKAIEENTEPLAGLHREVMRLVKAPEFTFWDSSGDK
ncbi:MAG: hypothetical protein AAF756_05650 [Pseudomonadota bacterium]